MIEYTILERIVSDYDEGMQRVADTMRPMIRSFVQFVNDTPRSFFDDWAIEHDHRRRYVMRRKIRRAYR